MKYKEDKKKNKRVGLEENTTKESHDEYISMKSYEWKQRDKPFVVPTEQQWKQYYGLRTEWTQVTQIQPTSADPSIDLFRHMASRNPAKTRTLILMNMIGMMKTQDIRKRFEITSRRLLSKCHNFLK
jgi:hypothetical protein